MERMLKLSDAGVENRTVSVECNVSKPIKEVIKIRSDPDQCSDRNVVHYLKTAE